MTEPKIAQRLEVVANLLYEANLFVGTILPSFEHNWLKWSCDNYHLQRQLVGV